MRIAMAIAVLMVLAGSPARGAAPLRERPVRQRDASAVCSDSIAKMLTTPHAAAFEAVLTSRSIREQHRGTWHWQDADHYRMRVERDHRQEYKGKSLRSGGVTIVARNPAERFVMSEEKGAAPRAQVCRDPAMIRALELEWNEISDRYPALLWLSHNASLYDWTFATADNDEDALVVLSGKLSEQRYEAVATERLAEFRTFVPEAAQAVTSMARVSKRPVGQILCMLAPKSALLTIDPGTEFVTGIELDAGFTFRGAIKKIVWRQRELSLDVKHDEALFTYEVPEDTSIRVLEPPKPAEEMETEN